MKRYLGGYISCAGGLYKAVERAEALEINTVMIHPTPPQRWNTKAFEKDVIDKFNESRAKSHIEKLFFHGIYLINLANPDKQKFHLSKMSLVNYLDLAEAINADGVVFHTGSFKDQPDENEGYARVVKGLKWIYENSTNDRKLALEVAAGAGQVVGSKFEHLARIYDMLDSESQKRTTFCLDTAHLFGSGYDIKDNLESIVGELDKTIGIDKISAVHFNDSKVELNSKKDRHENLGKGLIGENAMKAFLNHAKLKHLPFIMETPDMKDELTSTNQVEILKSWAS